MIKKVIFAGIFLCLCIAVPLAIMGYDHVTLGPSFMAFMRNVSNELESHKIAIPNIPEIPRFEPQVAEGDDILTFLANLLNGIIFIVNLLVKLVNIISMVINVIIQLVQMIVIIIKNLVTFKNSLNSTPLPVV